MAKVCRPLVRISESNVQLEATGWNDLMSCMLAARWADRQYRLHTSADVVRDRIAIIHLSLLIISRHAMLQYNSVCVRSLRCLDELTACILLHSHACAFS